MKGGEWSVWAADADGSDAHRITTGLVHSVSPDGRFVAYVDPYDEELRLSLLDLEASKTRDLGPTSPLAWSPDGRTLVTSNRRWLALVDVESGGSRKVAQGGVWSASFSPDGKAIVFAEGYALGGNLRVLRLSDRHLSEHATGGDHPVWGTSWIAFARWQSTTSSGRTTAPLAPSTSFVPTAAGFTS